MMAQEKSRGHDAGKRLLVLKIPLSERELEVARRGAENVGLRLAPYVRRVLLAATWPSERLR